MPEVAVQRISFPDRADFARRLVAALRAKGATEVGAQILTAHVAVSTGWGKSVDNYRLAGMKAGTTWRATKPFTTVTGCECVDGLENKSDPKCICAAGKGQKYSKSYWRAYGSLEEAAADFLALLGGSKYAAALALAQAGDVSYFTAVGKAGWYTADTTKVQRAGEAALEELRGYLGGVASASDYAMPIALALAAFAAYRLLA